MDSKATTKILDYIDEQDVPKELSTIQSEIRSVINAHLSVQERNAILANVMAYSKYYPNKIIEVVVK